MSERIETLAEKRFTQEYSQPEDYRFCQDSVLAPLLVARDLASTPIDRALDVGAGCGVMGLELAHAKPDIERFDFLEIQPVFRSHFEINRAKAGHSPERYRWIQSSWRVLELEPFRGLYDLVISNPPYFHAGDGRLGESDVSNRARFFLDDTFEGYAQVLRATLKPGGRAYTLVKTGERHGRETMTLLKTLVWDCEVERIADVRGTDLVKITAPS